LKKDHSLTFCTLSSLVEKNFFPIICKQRYNWNNANIGVKHQSTSCLSIIWLYLKEEYQIHMIHKMSAVSGNIDEYDIQFIVKRQE
jgi:hypothetical protein